MMVRLVDTLPSECGSDETWRHPERAVLSSLLRNGAQCYVSNVKTGFLALESGPHLLPVTVNDCEVGGSYVCLPHSAYCLYAIRELELVEGGRYRSLAPLVGGAGRLLLAAGLNRIVHIDNWLLSTNLHGNWMGEGIAEMLNMLAQKFPEQIIAIRSLDAWSSAELLKAAQAAGCALVPSRQIWVTDDLPARWASRHNVREDRRMLRRSGLHLEDPRVLDQKDARRIAELYRMLYVGKYSALNPVFTEDFIRLAHETGWLLFRSARAADGTIMAVAGSLMRNGILTPPVVGYDTSRPQREGLYRIASLLFGDQALESGCRLHGSAGAGEFKRNRGAAGVIEYTAMFVRHLPAYRRAAVHALAYGLQRWAVPLMQRRGL